MASKLCLLTTVPNMVEAEILKSALESVNIPVFLKWESFNTVMFGHAATGPNSQVQVFVREDDFTEARAYLAVTE
ncbi:hypothetical protein Desca_2331 [Desulfotomaculum nigrificans CO-1-SRB]|uniref:DUF2007 domain-containing protein n=1 Tax=Desulfotomaculum nigrificans (strain DSM 14880 / VKM B-2319 / CO-1-SRB) TaxID=868595 RepID=F6B3D5_DESCC|nr:DUF2007 domain-containing protein [Desulfotomaculum nigrificans]AEF95166.1 hypothetical protein Desca_2331 [Desulfotomaculum nigrificans CO-1-SRB]